MVTAVFSPKVCTKSHSQQHVGAYFLTLMLGLEIINIFGLPLFRGMNCISSFTFFLIPIELRKYFI